MILYEAFQVLLLGVASVCLLPYLSLLAFAPHTCSISLSPLIYAVTLHNLIIFSSHWFLWFLNILFSIPLLTCSPSNKWRTGMGERRHGSGGRQGSGICAIAFRRRKKEERKIFALGMGERLSSSWWCVTSQTARHYYHVIMYMNIYYSMMLWGSMPMSDDIYWRCVLAALGETGGRRKWDSPILLLPMPWYSDLLCCDDSGDRGNLLEGPFPEPVWLMENVWVCVCVGWHSCCFSVAVSMIDRAGVEPPSPASLYCIVSPQSVLTPYLWRDPREHCTP